MITGIVCVDIKNGIGKNGDIPWNIKEDKIFFSHITKSTILSMNEDKKIDDNSKSIMLMGVKTWNSMPYLPDREFIVISSGNTEIIKKKDKKDNEIMPLIYKDIETVVNKYKNKNLFIIGGKRIYEEGIKYCDTFIISKLSEDYDCDVNIDLDNELNTGGFKLKKYDINNNLKIYKYTKGEKNITEEDNYLSLFDELVKSNPRETRNAITRSIFGKHITFDLTKGFPLLTTKEMFFKGIVEELLFMLKGKTNTNELSEKGIKIWEGNTNKEFLKNRGLNYPEGYMGPMYGYQLRNYNKKYKIDEDDNEKENEMDEDTGIDQLNILINKLKNNPNDRRLIMTTLNIAQVEQGVLWPCHGLVIQFYIEENKLSCIMYQRSADYFLGLPFNIASYALLMHIICSILRKMGVNYTPDKLHIFIGDLHIYEDHLCQGLAQNFREATDFPVLDIKNDYEKVEDYTIEDFKLNDYKYYPKIIAKMIA